MSLAASLFLLMTSRLTFAATPENISSKDQRPIADLPQFSATEAQRASPPCAKILSDDELQKVLQTPTGNASEDALETRTSRGIEFSNEPKWLLDTFELLTASPIEGNTTTFESECSHVLCAVKEIFGPEIGPKLVYIYKKYGFNGSHLPAAHSSPWSETELNDVVSALELFPPGTLPVTPLLPLIRYEHGARIGGDSKNSFAGRSEGLFFYDLWSAQDPALRRYLAFQELAHLIERKADELNGKNSPCLTSQRARENAREDFAESVATYRYAPEWLKARCPAKYEIIKTQIFAGNEYLSSSACRQK